MDDSFQPEWGKNHILASNDSTETEKRKKKGKEREKKIETDGEVREETETEGEKGGEREEGKKGKKDIVVQRDGEIVWTEKYR